MEKNCTYSMGKDNHSLKDTGYQNIVETSITIDATPPEIQSWGWIGLLITFIMIVILILVIILYC